jgi:hypothetical protein
VQVRDDHLGQRGLDGDGGEQAVKGGVRRLVVKGIKRRAQSRGDVADW